MSGVVLSSATRQNLLSAQQTSDLLAQTQNRLATGKKVNSALDNPLNFFTASSLDSRAGDISTLLDAISNGVQTIQAASTGITNIQKLVDSAKSTANQALSTTISTTGAAGTAFGAASTGGAVLAAAGTTTGTAVSGLVGSGALSGATGGGFVAGDTLTVGTHTYTFTATGSTTSGDNVSVDDTLTTFLGKIKTDLGGSTADASIASNQVTLKAKATTDDLIVGGSAVSKLGLTAQTYAHTPASGATVKGQLTASASVTFKVNGTSVSGTIAAASTAAAAATYLNGLTGVPTGTFGVDANGRITVNATADIEITDATTKTALGFDNTANTQASALTVSGVDTRANLATQYNDLLKQIDQLAGDASYNGVNLLNSAATSNKLHLSFNEKDTSNLDVQGVNAKSSGLSLTAIDVTAGGTGNFINDADIKSTITKLTSATTALRSYSSTFGSNLTVVQNRQDFSKSLINVLQTGSSNLTDADLNEEAANSQALSTRQSLAISSLSLANTAQQQVLQLLR